MKIYTGIHNFCYQEQLLEEASSLGAQCVMYGTEKTKLQHLYQNFGMH